MRWVLFSLVTVATLAAQESHHLEIDNPWVRVFRITLAPHQTSSIHEHHDAILVNLKDSSVRYAPRAWSREQNPSDQPLRMVLVELKSDAPRLPSAPITLDPVKLDPKYHTVPFENDRVRVLRTVLEPRIKSPMHEHPHYVVVYLTELHTTMRMADGRELDNPRNPGDIAWRDALKHETENIGPRTAIEFQIEIK
jgi:predicted metal-dependent enzyme (double-stranded beta helix superfamily)